MIKIRKCGAQDFEAILALLKQLWPSKKLDEKTFL